MAKRKRKGDNRPLDNLLPDLSSILPDFAFPNFDEWDRAMDKLFAGLEKIGTGLPE
jgi:hypothetical protein